VPHAHEWSGAICCARQIVGENSYLQNRSPVGSQ
jgi:hypothetical protein